MNTPYFDESNLVTKVRMIMAYYWSDGGSEEDDYDDVVRGCKLAHKLVEGKTDKFTSDDWWIFADALGCVDGKKYPDIAALHVLADRMWSKSQKENLV